MCFRFVSFNVQFICMLLRRNETRREVISVQVRHVTIIRISGIYSYFSRGICDLMNIYITLFRFLNELMSIMMTINPLLRHISKLRKDCRCRRIGIRFFTLLRNATTAMYLSICLISFLFVTSTTFAIIGPK